MTTVPLEIRDAGAKGRGVFATARIAKGAYLVSSTGWLIKSEDLTEDLFALQVDDDLWLYSHGNELDDCINHSCEPNAGFTDGRPVLYALRDISSGEEITFDYSTSINEAGWRLECACGVACCRQIILPFCELPASFRDELAYAALEYLRPRSPM